MSDTFAALHRQIQSLTAMVRDLSCWLGHDAPKELVEDANRMIAEWEDGQAESQETKP